MKFTLVCTECRERFTVSGDLDWDNVECPACRYVGSIIGRILDGQTHYFADEEDNEAD